ncbi:hypothetical protein [Roseovarius sp. C03]|uniref:hypothetical protein n=1 Tax=Roseovarius sp. C03 TaxID=3449222 RepID=UPI003EDC5A9C
MSKTIQPGEALPGDRLPTPGEFRAWLRDSIAALDVAPFRLACRAGLSRNAAARILKADGDLYLGSAGALERELRVIAVERGVDLAPIIPGEARP